jgi:hypothetical protein
MMGDLGFEKGREISLHGVSITRLMNMLLDHDYEEGLQ